MTKEYFFGVTLKGAKSYESWDPEADGANVIKESHKLVIKQVLLGPEAKEGEVNVLEVQTEHWGVPVAVLKAGGAKNQILLDLTFSNLISFHLLQGNGPIHIIGHHVITIMKESAKIDKIEKEMIEDEEEEEEEADQMNNIIYRMENIMKKSGTSEIQIATKNFDNKIKRIIYLIIERRIKMRKNPKIKKAIIMINAKGKTGIKNIIKNSRTNKRKISYENLVIKERMWIKKLMKMKKLKL